MSSGAKAPSFNAVTTRQEVQGDRKKRIIVSLVDPPATKTPCAAFSFGPGCGDQPRGPAESDPGGPERLPGPAGDEFGHWCRGCYGWLVFG